MSLEGVKSNEDLADDLLTLEQKANGEVGLPFVRSIAMLWRRGEVEDARQIARNENDKLRQYPDIQQWLEDNLFGPHIIDSPLKRAQRWSSDPTHEEGN